MNLRYMLRPFWIKKIRVVAELSCVVVLGFLLGGILLEGHIGSRCLSAFGVFLLKSRTAVAVSHSRVVVGNPTCV